MSTPPRKQVVRGRITLGFKPRTGRACVVAVAGPVGAPEVVAKTRIDLATTFEESAVYHMAQGLSLAKARALLESAEKRFIAQARRQIETLAASLHGKIVGAGFVAPEAKSLPRLEVVLKSHPLIHAAEGELYRRVFIAACDTLGRVPRPRLPADSLADRTAARLGLTRAQLDARLAAMGKASGKPWAAEQKQSALAAWLVLAGE